MDSVSVLKRKTGGSTGTRRRGGGGGDSHLGLHNTDADRLISVNGYTTNNKDNSSEK